MARILTEAYNNKVFAEICGTQTYEVPATNMTDAPRKLTTTNYMIDNSVIPQYLDNNVKGGLASYSEGSGANIVVVSEYKDMRLACVVLGAMRVFDAEETWKPTSYGNFDEMQVLLEYLYGGFKVNQILYDGQALTQFQVIDGESDVVGKAVVNYNTVLPVDCNMDNLYMKFTATGDGYQAPITEGDKIATVAVQYRNSYIAEAEIFALNSVKNSSDTGVTIRSTAAKEKGEMSGFMSFVGVPAVIAVGLFGCYVLYNSYRRAKRRMQHRRRRASRRRSY
jgi:D-alanyl-D-alanine carboxypeptidase